MSEPSAYLNQPCQVSNPKGERCWFPKGHKGPHDWELPSIEDVRGILPSDSLHPVDPQTRLRELAREGAWLQHRNAVSVEAPWPREGHQISFQICPHPDCVLVRSAAAALLQEEPPSIDCPLCGLAVRQVSSATLSLALWQHFNWMHYATKTMYEATTKAAAAAPREEPAQHFEELRKERDNIRACLDSLVRDIKTEMGDRYRAIVDETGGDISVNTAFKAALREERAARGEEPAPPPPLLIDRIVQEVAELPDRTSPDDWPEAMLVTADELRAILSAALPEARSAPQLLEAAKDAAREYRLHGQLTDSCRHLEAAIKAAEAPEARPAPPTTEPLK